MRQIIKGNEPDSLAKWKRKNPSLRYADLPSDGEIRKEIRDFCITEQHGLCAYCCQLIDVEHSHNEHIEPQCKAPNKTLEFSNIVASCDRKKQCGDAHKAQLLPLTPLMAECETELKYYLSGKVVGLTDRAKALIDAINLGSDSSRNRNLVATRKAMIDQLLFSEGLPPERLLEIESDEILQILLNNFMNPDEDGLLRPFVPVLSNIVRALLQSGN